MLSPSLTLLRTQSDERLVELARGGHERAFEAIVERYRRALLRGARRVLPEARAEDALQQALLSAWTALQRGDEVRDLRAWLYRIVHNCALNALRVSGYDYDELRETLRITDAPGDELERRAVVRQTLTSLASLPDRQREALLRTAISGRSQEEVARDLGVSDGALRQLVHRARVSMRAAATAVTPLPLVNWLAAGGASGAPLTDRIAELAAGAAPAGAAATLAKAGTVAVLAGSAFTGPALVDREADRPQGDAAASAATEPRSASRAQRPVPVTGERRPVRRVVAHERPVRRVAAHREPNSSGRGGRRRGRRGGSGRGQPRHEDAEEHRDDDRSGRGDRDEVRDETEAEHEDHSGSNSSDDREVDAESDGDRASGRGSGGEAEPVSNGPPPPLETVAPPATPDELEDLEPEPGTDRDSDSESADSGRG
ncbi:MAG TPA: sigma-70 family RNA polymerase sigma factor [Solirubrobacteraceae bacterium]|nr:sigma-70 family RNA polymerase sigma factor [Solirubrobacteraceae bacterium]